MKTESIPVLTPPLTPERRFVYNGDTLPKTPSFTPRGNRPVKRRKRSPFNIVIVLVIISAVIVFYVWNKITVNRLVVEVNDLQMEHQKIINANEIIRADINKKSSLERIGKVATGQLGLTYPKEQPVWFSLDADRMAKLQQ